MELLKNIILASFKRIKRKMIKENKEIMMLSEHIGMTESVQIINDLFSGVSWWLRW